MTEAFRLQLKNFIKEEEEDEFIEMELKARVAVPHYVLIPEYLKCPSLTAGSQNDELEILNQMSTIEIYLFGLIQENCLKIYEPSFIIATSSHSDASSGTDSY